MAKCRQLVVPRFGPGATATLARVVAEAQRDNPLAPVDVVTPKRGQPYDAAAAIADPALANVRFGSLPQLAERLALRRLGRGANFAGARTPRTAGSTLTHGQITRRKWPRLATLVV